VKAAVVHTGEEVLDSREAVRLRLLLGEYYLRYDSYDQMSFPLYYDTDSGEPATVEVVRISPEDAPSLIDETDPTEHRRKLAGTALGNFSAFLERRWRTNDIMWGRLDGSERLIAALLPSQDPNTIEVRRALTAEAHRAILREALVPEGYDELTKLLCDAIAEQGMNETPPSLADDLIRRLAPSNPITRRRLEAIVAALLEGDGLSKWVKERRDIDRKPDPQATLENASRAVTVTGRVLEGVVKDQNGSPTTLRWLTRAGLAAQGLVALSIPGSILWHLRRHWLALLYAFELVALVIGIVFGPAGMRTAMLTALGVTVATHLATLLLADAMRSKRRWVVGLIVAASMTVLVLAGLGALVLAQDGLNILSRMF
jgi:hypothetical protein